MPTQIRYLATLFLLVLSCQVIAKDYPMFSAYPGAKEEGTLVLDYEQVSLPLAIPRSKDATPPLLVNGDLYKNTYRIKNVSTLKLFENYRQAATAAGFKMLFSITPETCDYSTCSVIGDRMSVKGNIYTFSRKPYYWIGVKDSSKGKIIAAWYIGGFEDVSYVNQVIVETEPLENNLIAINASYSNSIPDEIAPKELSGAEKAKDHPLLPRYPRASLSKSTKADTETFKFPVAVNSPDQTPHIYTGDLARHNYIITNVSTLKVFENYKQALVKAGFTFISQCELNDCGDSADVTALGDQLALGGNIYVHGRKPYYILAKKPINGANTYVALFIGGFDDTTKIQQVILEEKAVVTGLVTVNADQLKQQIDEDGKALIYGIYFDTGKATIKAESKPTLDAIAELLKRNPDLLLYVVGHTDDTGNVASNLTLSEQRAKSVRDALITDYQVLASRLQAYGVGPYAPASNNTSDAGKQKNRRVELVKRLQ